LIGYLRNPFAGELTLFDNPLSRDALFKAQSDAIRDLAARESCIFVGRCADYVLRDHPHCVNLFISAPDATRVQRLMHDRQIDEAEAARLVASDDSRAAYYNHFSNRTWGMASTYHLCIDSSVLGIEGTADLAEQFIRRKLSDIL
jgi:cytidylate kinase